MGTEPHLGRFMISAGMRSLTASRRIALVRHAAQLDVTRHRDEVLDQLVDRETARGFRWTPPCSSDPVHQELDQVGLHIDAADPIERAAGASLNSAVRPCTDRRRRSLSPEQSAADAHRNTAKFSKYRSRMSGFQCEEGSRAIRPQPCGRARTTAGPGRRLAAATAPIGEPSRAFQRVTR